jgi:hypothetical protein
MQSRPTAICKSQHSNLPKRELQEAKNANPKRVKKINKISRSKKFSSQTPPKGKKLITKEK